MLYCETRSTLPQSILGRGLGCKRSRLFPSTEPQLTHYQKHSAAAFGRQQSSETKCLLGQALVFTLAVDYLILAVVSCTSEQLVPQTYYADIAAVSSLATLATIKLGITATTGLVQACDSVKAILPRNRSGRNL